MKIKLNHSIQEFETLKSSNSDLISLNIKNIINNDEATQ